jgi:hypothetical protein
MTCGHSPAAAQAVPGQPEAFAHAVALSHWVELAQAFAAAHAVDLLQHAPFAQAVSAPAACSQETVLQTVAFWQQAFVLAQAVSQPGSLAQACKAAQALDSSQCPVLQFPDSQFPSSPITILPNIAAITASLQAAFSQPCSP